MIFFLSTIEEPVRGCVMAFVTVDTWILKEDPLHEVHVAVKKRLIIAHIDDAKVDTIELKTHTHPFRVHSS